MSTAAHSSKPGRYGFAHVARMEWIKLRSLRSTTYALLATAVGMIAIGIATMASTNAPANAAEAVSFDPVNNVMAGVAVGQLIIGVLGVLMITAEHTSGSIRSTLAAVPDRRLLLAVKVSVLGLLALTVGQVVAFVTFFVGRAVLSGEVPPPSLSDGGVLRAVVLSGAYLPMIGLIGIGIGAITRHTASAIGALVGLLFVVPAVVAGSTGTTIAKFFPTMIAGNSLGVSRSMPDMLTPWVGFGVLCLYVAVALGAGWYVLARRDT